MKRGSYKVPSYRRTQCKVAKTYTPSHTELYLHTSSTHELLHVCIDSSTQGMHELHYGFHCSLHLIGKLAQLRGVVKQQRESQSPGEMKYVNVSTLADRQYTGECLHTVWLHKC